ncbi:MAG: type II toxin-antitoxin system RelE/ParE family toxin [Candidatus Marinimicrobia bacterium]|nr:type II toxin-antitoxin system RelE/ParE family toxin [Candidatus Neomarinimicrobiota bacterium]
MYEIRYSKHSKKYLMKTQRKFADSIMSELEKLSIDPQSYQGDWKRMKGVPFWRLRKGGWRAICEIIESKLVIHVLKIGPRGDVYK